jgi:RNA polymerase sigma-70 factor (ECF subfamily)
MQPKNDAGSIESEPLRQADRLARRIRAAECGDERAVRALLVAVAPTVSRVVGLVLGPRHPDADDLVQESLVDFLRALPAGGDEIELGQLAAFVSLRRALEAWKWSPGAYEVLAPEGDEQPRWSWLLSAERAERDRQRRMLSRLLTTLPDEEAEVLGLRVLAGLDIEQIAEFVGLSPNAVRSRLRLAKRQLLDELGTPSDQAGIELHPEALRDLERAGRLAPADRLRLENHEHECAACALERSVAADFIRRWPRLPGAGVRLGRAIDAATAQWVWNVSRRVTFPKRRRRLTWVAALALVAVTALAAGGLWLRYFQPADSDSQASDVGESSSEL